jgi:hypothetical protein
MRVRNPETHCSVAPHKKNVCVRWREAGAFNILQQAGEPGGVRSDEEFKSSMSDKYNKEM